MSHKSHTARWQASDQRSPGTVLVAEDARFGADRAWPAWARRATAAWALKAKSTPCMSIPPFWDAAPGRALLAGAFELSRTASCAPA